MKEYKNLQTKNGNRIFELSNKELDIIHSALYYMLDDSELTPLARKISRYMEKKLRLDDCKGIIKKWKD